MTATFGILTDITKCVGCNKCTKACVKEHKQPRMTPRTQDNGDGLSAVRYTSLIRVSRDRFVRKQCRHCLEPACASACIVGALRKSESGAVVYDEDKCIGCRYCMMACPYGIPRYEWDKVAPYVRKCTLCAERVVEGEAPRCVEACPEEATIFGEREALLEEARRRLKENPDRYVQHIYGEHEVGGTSVLYLSDVPLNFLAWDEEPDTEPLPELTWAALSKVPGVALGMGAVMSGTYWIVNRRDRLMKENSKLGDCDA